MKIAIVSGKGGTGKTTVAVNLALSLADEIEVQLIDCDVEEPNVHLFLNTSLEIVEDITVPTPVFDEDMCNFCGKCAILCQYNAIAVLPKNIMLLEESCRGCGLCSIACPKEAITEKPRKIGEIKRGYKNGKIEFYQGILKIGEAISTSIIQALKSKTREDKFVILDAPPGNACPTIKTVEDVDFCILVTEPTPFGFYDLTLSIKLINAMKIPFGVIINKDGIGDNSVEKYCEEKEIPLLMKIPYDLEIAKFYSKGIPFVNEMLGWKEEFLNLYQHIKEGEK